MSKFFKYHIDIFNSAFNSEDTQYVSSESTRRQYQLHLIVFTGLVFLILFGFYALFKGNYNQAVMDFILAAVSYILDYFLRKYNKVILVSWIFVSILSGLFLYLIVAQSDSLSGHLWSFMVPISVIFLLRGRTGLFFNLVYIAIVDVFFILDYPAGQYDYYFKLRFTGVLLAVSLVAYFLEMVRYKTQTDLEAKNAELDKTNKELNKKERELEESSKRYRLLFEESNEAIILMEGTRFTDFNRKALEMFGYSRNEFLELNAMDLAPPRQPDRISSRVKAVEYLKKARLNNSTRFEWLHKRKDSSLFTADINLQMLGAGKFFATIRDIDYLKNTENFLRKAKEEAEKSDQLKSDFLAQMSHEIRTPINIILNYSSLLKVELAEKLNAEDTEAFSAIEDSASRLMRTMNLLLNVAEIESGTLAPVFVEVDLVKEVITPILREMEPLAKEKKLELKFENIIDEPVILKLDQYSINQSVGNIIDNAIKYTRKGWISIILSRSGENIILEILDSGIGISDDYMPKIFDKFTQEQQGYSRSFEGNGLGLALVREYCKINNVKIDVESNKGFGSKFTLIFSPESQASK